MSKSPAFLMCRPTHYRISYEINPWMSLKHPVTGGLALQQWKTLYLILSKELGATIRLIRPSRGVPDLVFTANAGLVVAEDRFIRSNFRHQERRPEQPIFQRYFERRGYQVSLLPKNFNFEGEGDALWIGDTLLLGFCFRSDAPTHRLLAELLGKRVLPLELVDERFYHLDTCFCPLDAATALWFPPAFDHYGKRVLKDQIPDLIAVSEADALRFCCNAVVVGKTVVLQRGVSGKLRRELEGRGFTIRPVDLSEFMKAGGSAKCLVLRLTHRHRDRSSLRNQDGRPR